MFWGSNKAIGPVLITFGASGSHTWQITGSLSDLRLAMFFLHSLFTLGIAYFFLSSVKLSKYKVLLSQIVIEGLQLDPAPGILGSLNNGQ